MAFALAESGPEGDAEGLAFAVVFGEQGGAEWDWEGMRWRPAD